MIKVLSNLRNSRIICCTECGAEEQNHVLGRKYENLKRFIVSGKEDYYGFKDDITCIACGHVDKLGHFQLASLSHSETIHLGVTQLNDHFISRCGHVVACFSNGGLEFIDAQDLRSGNSKFCGSCEMNEGSSALDRKQASESDKRVISAFHEGCENSREPA